MPPTLSTVITTPTSTSSTKPPQHSNQVSIPAMIVLAFLLLMMAALTVGVIFRQRRAMKALRRKKADSEIPEKSPSLSFDRTSWSLLSRFKPRSESTACVEESMITAVGALHAASVLVAAAPLSPPVMMQFRVPLGDKIIVMLGLPWLSYQCCGGPTGGYHTLIPNDDDSRSPVIHESAALDNPFLGTSARRLEDPTVHHFAIMNSNF